MKKKLKTVAYCRVSTNKAEQLDSLESQRSFFLEYAKKYNYDLVHIYADEGKSGTKIKNRIQLQQLLKDAKDNKFELVLIKDVSRLARNTVDFLTSIRKLKSYGIKVVFVNYDQTSSDSSEFMLTMLSAIAQEESFNISKRIKFGKRINAKKGRVPNICYGYTKLNGNYFDLDINEEEAMVVRKIFELYTKDLMGAGSIAKKLNEDGIMTKRDCKWTQTGVVRVLTNELYTGKIINGKEEVIDFLTGKRVKKQKEDWIVVNRPDLQIISQAIFDEANKILNERRDNYKKTNKRRSEKYAFSKLIWCDTCSYHFRRIVRTYKKTYVRWVCYGRNTNGVNSCSNKTVLDEKQLMEIIRNYFINTLLKKPKYNKYMVSEFCRKYQKRNPIFQNERDYKKRLHKLERARKKYIKLYREEIITLLELRSYIMQIQDDMEYLNRELEMIENNANRIQALERFAAELFRNLDYVIKNHEFTNNELKKVIEKIIIKDKGDINIYIVRFDKTKTFV